MATTLVEELLTVYKFRERGARNVERATDRISRTLSGASRLAAGFGTALTTGLAGVIKIMASHETELATFAAKTGQAMEDVTAKYGAAVERIGQRTGVAFADVTRGMEKAYSGGVRATDELIHVTDKAAKFQAAGLGDIAENLSTATTLANVFGITTSEALDLIAASATRGEGDSANYARAWKEAGSIAKNVGLTHTELGAILVTASQEMKSVTKAGTSLIQFLTLMLRPTDRATKALADFASVNLDIESIQKRVRAGDFKGVYEDLQRLIAANPDLLGQILEGTEAMQAFFAVPAAKLMAEEPALIDEIPGAIDRAFEQGANTIERQIKRLLNDFKSFILDLGDTMRPTINEMMTLARELMQEVRDLSPEVKKLVGQLLLMGPPLLVLSGVLAGVSVILTPFGKLLGWIFGAGGVLALFTKSTIGTAIGVFFLDMVKWLGILGRGLLTLGGVVNPLVGAILLVAGAILLFKDELIALTDWFRSKFGIDDLPEVQGGAPEDDLPDWLPDWVTGKKAKALEDDVADTSAAVAEGRGEPGEPPAPTADSTVLPGEPPALPAAAAGAPPPGDPRGLVPAMADMLRQAFATPEAPADSTVLPGEPGAIPALPEGDQAGMRAILTDLLYRPTGGGEAAITAAQTGALLEVPAFGLGGVGGGAGGGAGPTSRTLNFTVDSLTVQSQATDPQGIARDIREALEAELQSTAEDFDSAIEG